MDYLKIDGSFIRDTANDPVDYAMIRIIHQIGDVLDIRTIAESVEQRTVLAKLKELGVDYARGLKSQNQLQSRKSLKRFPKGV